MAYFSIVNLATTGRELTPEEQATRDNYLAAQVSAGTTDGHVYSWAYNVNPEEGTSQQQQVRMWSTAESANGFKTLFANFVPPVVVQVY